MRTFSALWYMGTRGERKALRSSGTDCLSAVEWHSCCSALIGLKPGAPSSSFYNTHTPFAVLTYGLRASQDFTHTLYLDQFSTVWFPDMESLAICGGISSQTDHCLSNHTCPGFHLSLQCHWDMNQKTSKDLIFHRKTAASPLQCKKGSWMELFYAESRLNANLEFRQAIQVKHCGLLYPLAHTARPSYTSSFTLQAPAPVGCFTDSNVTFLAQRAQKT